VRAPFVIAGLALVAVASTSVACAVSGAEFLREGQPQVLAPSSVPTVARDVPALSAETHAHALTLDVVDGGVSRQSVSLGFIGDTRLGRNGDRGATHVPPWWRPFPSSWSLSLSRKR
jgi:hypothetical protein